MVRIVPILSHRKHPLRGEARPIRAAVNCSCHRTRGWANVWGWPKFSHWGTLAKLPCSIRWERSRPRRISGRADERVERESKVGRIWGPLTREDVEAGRAQPPASMSAGTMWMSQPLQAGAGSGPGVGQRAPHHPILSHRQCVCATPSHPGQGSASLETRLGYRDPARKSRQEAMR